MRITSIEILHTHTHSGRDEVAKSFERKLILINLLTLLHISAMLHAQCFFFVSFLQQFNFLKNKPRKMFRQNCRVEVAQTHIQKTWPLFACVYFWLYVWLRWWVRCAHRDEWAIWAVFFFKFKLIMMSIHFDSKLRTERTNKIAKKWQNLNLFIGT